MGDTVSLAHGHIEVEERPGYLLMVEHGTLRTVDDVAQYTSAMEILAERSGLRRAVIDSRQADAVEPPRDVREAMWRWLLSSRAFDQIAFVLDNEMGLARVNMTALSQRANIKAFTAVHEAHRWLTGRQRTLSQGMPAVTGQLPPRSDAPPRTPPPPRMTAAPRTPTPPPRAPFGPESGSGEPSGPAWTPPPPRRLSTPPPPADRSVTTDRSSTATRRTSEIAIPIPRAPDSRVPEARPPEPRLPDMRPRDTGVHGLATRRTGELTVRRSPSQPLSSQRAVTPQPLTPSPTSRRSEVLPVVPGDPDDDDTSSGG